MTTLIDARPKVEFDSDYRRMCDAYRHEDGSITYVVYDEDGSDANPRADDLLNIASLVQRNNHCIDLDEADDMLAEARRRWLWMDVANGNTSCVGLAGACTCRYCNSKVPALLRAKGYDHEAMVRRYIAICRPDVLYYSGYWSAGESYGWGYVTRDAWNAAMSPPQLSQAQAEALLAGEFPALDDVRAAYDSEVKVFGQWANGEVYGAVHVTTGEPIVRFWEHGAYYTGEYTDDEESCWGFLGYDDHKQIAAQFTDSPITEVLA